MTALTVSYNLKRKRFHIDIMWNVRKCELLKKLISPSAEYMRRWTVQYQTIV